jgi:hypothetical protein
VGVLIGTDIAFLFHEMLDHRLVVAILVYSSNNGAINQTNNDYGDENLEMKDTEANS